MLELIVACETLLLGIIFAAWLKSRSDNRLLRSTIQEMIGAMGKSAELQGKMSTTLKGVTGDFGRSVGNILDQIRDFIIEERKLGTNDTTLLNQVVSTLQALGSTAVSSAIISDLDIKTSKDPRHRDK